MWKLFCLKWKKYREISYRDLHEIQLNSASRYKHSYQDFNSNDVGTMNYDYSPFHVLNESMENVNMWVKSLPWKDKEESWLLHSANMSAAWRLMLFERQEYVRGLFNFEKILDEGITEFRMYKDKKCVSPKKAIEKQRVFEYLTIFFKEEIPSRRFDLDEMKQCIAKLTTKLLRDTNASKKVTSTKDDTYKQLDSYVMDINNIYDGNDDDVIINDIPHESHCDSDLSDSDDSDSDVEVDSETQDDSNAFPILGSTALSLHKYALVDIECTGNDSVLEKNYVMIRLRKKDRINRNDNFIKKVHCDVINKNKKIASSDDFLDLDLIDGINNDCTPQYTNKFRQLKVIK